MRHLLPLLVLVAGAAPPAWADICCYRFETIDVAGATSTQVLGINDRGDLVGSFTDSVGTHGFVRSGGVTTQIDILNFLSTEAAGINDSGQIVGTFRDPTSGRDRGFLLSPGGGLSFLDVPGPTATRASGINDAGQVVGSFSPGPGERFADAFLFSDGIYLSPTVAFPPSFDFIGGADINNNGLVVGSYIDLFLNDKTFGFQVGTETIPGPFSPLSIENSPITVSFGVNDDGLVVGHFRDVDEQFHGFIAAGGVFCQIDVPGAVTTTVRGINNKRVIVGHYTDAQGRVHGFRGVPCIPEPSAAALLAAGALGLLGYGRRRRFPD